MVLYLVIGLVAFLSGLLFGALLSRKALSMKIEGIEIQATTVKEVCILWHTLRSTDIARRAVEKAEGILLR